MMTLGDNDNRGIGVELRELRMRPWKVVGLVGLETESDNGTSGLLLN